MGDQRLKTIEHIEQVKKLLDLFCGELFYRGKVHDASKLEYPERETFDRYIPKLKDMTYGSDEYDECLKEMKVGLDHHYANNRHHPEHFTYYECNGCFTRFEEMPNVCDICGYSQFTERPDISKMNLIDIVEMFCDWKAATMRHEDGDLAKSIEINQKRFGFSDELASIFNNTIELFEK